MEAERMSLDEARKKRPTIVALAKDEFGIQGINALKAVSQFPKAQELVDLIQAKRDQVFDYGACIVETETGHAWPSRDVVLAVLRKAVSGELTEEDLEDLGLEPTAENLSKVTMGGTKPSKEKTKSRRRTKKKQEEEQVATKEEKKAEEGETLNLDALSEAFQELDTKLEQVLEQVSSSENRVLLAVRGLVGFVENVRDNLDVVAARQQVLLENIVPYLDDGNDAELPPLVEVSDEVVADLQQAFDLEVAPEVPSRPVAEEQLQQQEDSESEEEDEEHTTKGTNGVDGEIPSQETIEEMELPQLVELAERIGIANAGRIPYPAVLRRKICKEVGYIE